MPLPANPTYLRKNYLLAAIEGGFFMGGLTFLSMESVLPAMIHELGGAAWAVSIVPVLFYIGFGWPQIFSALWVERLHVMKPMLLTVGAFQRLPYLLTGLFMIIFGRDYPVASVTLAFLTPFISSTMSGIQGSAYFEFITRIVPVHRVASMWAIRNVMVALIGIAAGFIIKLILDTYPGVTGYGFLHLMTFGMMMMSILIFSALREDNIPEPHPGPPLTIKAGFASFAANWRANPSLGHFVITRMLFMALFIAVPFLSVRAIEQTGSKPSLVGMLVLAQMLGYITGNILTGYLGDRMGARLPMLIGRTVLLLNFLCVPFVFATWHFMIVFALLGFGFSTAQVGDMTMVIDFAPTIRRKFYFAVMGTLLVPGVLLASLISAGLQYITYGFHLACLLTPLGMGLSLFFLLRLEDPRRILQQKAS